VTRARPSGGLLPAIVPEQVAAVEAYEDRPGERPYPGEEDLVAGAARTRVQEFVTGRRCAREALAALGHHAVPLRRGPRREPLWPPGVVGSITHCAGFRAAAVAVRDAVAGVGIDAEPHEPLPGGVLRRVTSTEERAMLAGLGRRHPGIHWDRLVFSAKEAVYKAWFPLTGRWLGCRDATLTIDPDAGVFTARIPGADSGPQPPRDRMDGRFVVRHGLIATAVTVPARRVSDRPG